jgi:hypothetical protein
MGTTLSSSHLYAPHASERVHAQCVDKLREHLIARYDEVAPADAALIVTVASDLDGPWISVYLNWQFNLPGITASLSRTSACPALLIELFDSDVLKITLFENGAETDVFSDWINYESIPKRRSGSAEKWLSVLPEGRTPDDLAQAWRSDKADYPFESEGILQRLVDLLGLDPDRVWFDARYEEFETGDTRVTEFYLRPKQGA